jgi:hypothetical protein
MNCKPSGESRRIARFPDYEFYESGHVVSYKSGAPKTLKPITVGQYVGLQLKPATGSVKKEYLHRLICEAFSGPPEGRHCRHLDGDRSNNSASNLKWGTKAENESDKAKHGKLKGEGNAMAKLTQKRVEQMRAYRANTGDSYQKIASMFEVSAMTAYRAITRQSWS